jgi:hypothetical protein
MVDITKRFFRSVLLIAFAILLVNISRVSAVGEVTVYDGASIRLQTETTGQGLRFYATLDESVKANEHGFYLVYGKTTIAELEATSAQAGWAENWDYGIAAVYYSPNWAYDAFGVPYPL